MAQEEEQIEETHAISTGESKETITQKNQGKLKKLTTMIKTLIIMITITMIKMTMMRKTMNHHHINQNPIG